MPSAATIAAVLDVVLTYEGHSYVLPEDFATLLGEDLRLYAAGKFHTSELTRLPGVAPDWGEGALALADAIEDALTGTRTGPIPLAGKPASAAGAVLRVIVHSADPPGAPPGQRYAKRSWTPARVASRSRGLCRGTCATAWECISSFPHGAH